MKCPHCSNHIHVALQKRPLSAADDHEGRRVGWSTSHATCPSCHQIIIFLEAGFCNEAVNGTFIVHSHLSSMLVWPQSSLRPCPVEVPGEIANDFREANRIISVSPQASAALTRRSLQQILRDHGNTKSKDLFDQIQEVIDEGHLPPALSDQLDAVLVISNFAAHPLKSKTSGTILPVEPNEAEWNLDVLEDVFDHYFVKPAKVAARKAALNVKLSEAGKPQLR